MPRKLLWVVTWHQVRRVRRVYPLFMAENNKTCFWTATDLANKLQAYQAYDNEHRCHSGRDGSLPADSGSGKVIDIDNYRWEKHSRGLFQLPVAA